MSKTTDKMLVEAYIGLCLICISYDQIVRTVFYKSAKDDDRYKVALNEVCNKIRRKRKYVKENWQEI